MLANGPSVTSGRPSSHPFSPRGLPPTLAAMTSTRPEQSEIALPPSAPHPQADPEARPAHVRARPGARVPLVVGAGARSTRSSIAGGEGSWFWDGDGKPLPRLLRPARLHATSASAPEGRRGDPGAGRAARTVAPQHANAARSEAARLIAERAPASGSSHVFFTNGGADAIENAVRMARLHTGRRKVLSRVPQLPRQHRRRRSTSPATRGAGQRLRRPRASCTFFGPFLYRSAFHAEHRAGGVRARAGSTSSRPSSSRGPRRSPRSSSSRSPAPPGSWCRRPATSRGPRDLRPVRHPLDRRRGHGGFGRAGAWFAVRARATAPSPT